MKRVVVCGPENTAGTTQTSCGSRWSVKPVVHIPTFSRQQFVADKYLATTHRPTIGRPIFQMPQKLLPTVDGEHTHNDCIELSTEKVVANMLTSEESVCVAGFRADHNCRHLPIRTVVDIYLFVQLSTFTYSYSCRHLPIRTIVDIYLFVQIWYRSTMDKLIIMFYVYICWILVTSAV